MFFRLSFVTFILALVALGTPVKRDATEVNEDVTNLTTLSQSLDKSINAFSNGTFEQAWDIHMAATKLDEAFQAAADDVTASGKFTDQEAAPIVKSLGRLVSVIQLGCKDITGKIGVARKLGVQTIVEEDLQHLKSSSDEFMTKFSFQVPADTQSEVQKQIDETDAAFTSAIDVYASS